MSVSPTKLMGMFKSPKKVEQVLDPFDVSEIVMLVMCWKTALMNV